MVSNTQVGMLRKQDVRLIFAATVLCVVVALAISYTARREYQANVRISVVPERFEQGTANALHDLLRNYAAQIESANPARTTGVRASAEPERLLISIRAAHPDAQVAGQLAQTAAAWFVDERTAYNMAREKGDRVDVSLLDPMPQVAPSHPRLLTDALGAGLLGAAGTALILVLRRRLRAEG